MITKISWTCPRNPYRTVIVDADYTHFSGTETTAIESAIKYKCGKCQCRWWRWEQDGQPPMAGCANPACDVTFEEAS